MKMNDFIFENLVLEFSWNLVLRVHVERIGLKINAKKPKSLNLGISKGEEVMLSNEKIEQVDSST